MDDALRRMRACVAMFRADATALEAFRLANRAMCDQMRQGDVGGGERDDAQQPRWRPFQLAFLLTVMESAIREDDRFRDSLDLIWFPTGGGKTEAYLGLIAFLILWRRLRYGRAGGGTVAFMRYTLRLLTRQQFERAARLICALELIRREDARLGEEAISVGIWVGQESTPNTFAQAGEAAERIKTGSSTGSTPCCWSIVLGAIVTSIRARATTPLIRVFTSIAATPTVHSAPATNLCPAMWWMKRSTRALPLC